MQHSPYTSRGANECEYIDDDLTVFVIPYYVQGTVFNLVSTITCPRIKTCWLPSQDSNLGLRIQSPVCYRYTTRHYAEGRTRTGTGVAPQQFLRLPRLPFRHFGGAEERSRTADTLIFSQVLYHLSYLGISGNSSPNRICVSS